MSRSKTFKLSEPVTVDGETFSEVTMNSFKGSAVATFIANRERVAAMGNENVQFYLCELSSGAPEALFKEMELEDYLLIVEFMAPHFDRMKVAMGNAAKANTSTSPASSN